MPNCRRPATSGRSPCKPGGNFGYDHQWQAAEAIRHVDVCYQRVALPEPEGRADPCP